MRDDNGDGQSLEDPIERPPNHADQQYRSYLIDILSGGHSSSTRTGTDTIKSFGHQMRFDLTEGFPLLTSKAVWFEGIARELLWFLRGQTNIWHLLKHNVGIWTDDAYRRYRQEAEDPHDKKTFEAFVRPITDRSELEDSPFAKRWGDLGDIYGKMWREYPAAGDEEPFDQIANLVAQLRENPDSRRLRVSAWHPRKHMKGAPAESGAVLPPCHVSFQVFTRELSLEERINLFWDRENHPPVAATSALVQTEKAQHQSLDQDGIPRRALSLKWNQRSVDSFLGLPFNIASYALLTHLICDQVNMLPEELIFQGGDCHIYEPHKDAVRELLSNEPAPNLPTLKLDTDETPEDLADYQYEDFRVEGYDHAGRVSAPLVT